MMGYNLQDLSFKAGQNRNHCILDTGDTHPSFEENGVTAENNTVEVSVTQAEVAMVEWREYLPSRAYRSKIKGITEPSVVHLSAPVPPS